VSAFIDEHRERFGVEPICGTLGVSASAYYQRATGERCQRRIEDERLLEVIRATHAANYYAYGYRRTWKALRRAGHEVGRDRVKRLMRRAAIQGAKRRGRPWRTTCPTRSRASAGRPDGPRSGRGTRGARSTVVPRARRFAVPASRRRGGTRR
jgi:putative transposase